MESSLNYINQSIIHRKSIRTYKKMPLNSLDKEILEKHIQKSSTNPFNQETQLKLLTFGNLAPHKMPATYGLVKGAKNFIAGICLPEKESLLALGYEMERIILFADHKKMGTCWLGSSFPRDSFISLLNLEKDKILPCITSVGYPAERPTILDQTVKNIARYGKRKQWINLFFDQTTTEPLSIENSQKYRKPLEMVRLAPSAKNLQPWRIIRNKHGFNFYKQLPGKNFGTPWDFQLIDLGIAIYHFEASCQELKIKGHWDTIDKHNEKDLEYLITWVPEE